MPQGLQQGDVRFDIIQSAMNSIETAAEIKGKEMVETKPD